MLHETQMQIKIDHIVLFDSRLFHAVHGCSSDSKQTIQIIVGNSYVSQENLDACEEELLASYPDWQGEETEIEFTPIDFGDPETDPYAGASIAKVSAMVTAKEIDLMICDTENAARFARSEMFVPVEEVLSEEELAQYEATPPPLPPKAASPCAPKCRREKRCGAS